jgi:hypothetical protein
MRYRQCRSCSFWVAPAERFCTNCGTYRPYQSGRAHRSAWLLFTTVLGGVLGGSVFSRGMDNAFLLYGCLAGCVTGLAWGLGLFSEVAAILLDRRRAPSLQSSELQLTGRLAEIERTRRQVQDLRRRLEAEGESASSVFLSPVLQKADAAVGRAAHRYAGELAKLELIRWRNGLEPIVAALPDGAACTDHHARLDAIHAHRERGRLLLRKWSAARLDAGDGGQEPVAQLRKWLATCDRIVERLIAEQARHTLGHIAAAELVPPPTPHIDRELSRLQTTDADLAPDELEQVQYALDRLHAKEQLDRDLRPRG